MGSVSPYSTSSGKRYRARYRTPDNRQVEKGGFRTKREAEQYLAAIEVAKTQGDWIDPSRARATVKACAVEWSAAQVHIKPTTRSGYQYTLNRHILPKWGNWPVGSVTHGAVQQWVSRLSVDLQPSTVRQTYFVLSSILELAVRDRRIGRNPCQNVLLPRIERRERGYLNHRQIDALATECGTDGDIVRFLAYTGLRWGEMVALRVADIDFARSRIRVSASVSEISGDLVWSTPKSHHARWVPAAELVRRLLEERCAGKRLDQPVFTSRTGGMLRASNFRHRIFNPAVARLQEREPDFPRITPHGLRHTTASLIVAAGGSVKVLQRMLGHSSGAMTLDVYADLFDDDLDSVARALDQHAQRNTPSNPSLTHRPTDPTVPLTGGAGSAPSADLS